MNGRELHGWSTVNRVVLKPFHANVALGQPGLDDRLFSRDPATLPRTSLMPADRSPFYDRPPVLRACDSERETREERLFTEVRWLKGQNRTLLALNSLSQHSRLHVVAARYIRHPPQCDALTSGSHQIDRIPRITVDRARRQVQECG